MTPFTRLSGPLLLVGALAACSKTPAPPAPAPAPGLRATVEKVQNVSIAPIVTLTGQLVARETVRVFSEVDGLIVRRVLVEAGETVRAGQPLLFVDTKPAQLELEQARAQQAQAVAEAQRLRQELERLRRVADVGGVSENALASSTLQLEAAEGQVRAATAARDIARRRLDQAGFRAPFTGVVLQRDVEVGDRTGANGTPYFVIAKDGEVEFEAFAAIRQLDAIRSGQSAAVHVDGRAGPQAGVVRAAAVAADGGTRSGRVRIRPENATFGPGGAPATATIALPGRTAPTVPASALRFDPQPWVWRVGADGIVSRQNVELGLPSADRYEVRAGLAADDRFVSDAGALLVEGDRVTPVEAAAPARDEMKEPRR